MSYYPGLPICIPISPCFISNQNLNEQTGTYTNLYTIIQKKIVYYPGQKSIKLKCWAQEIEIHTISKVFKQTN